MSVPDSGMVRVSLADAEERQKKGKQPVPSKRNPFSKKHSCVEDDDWETCEAVLNHVSMHEVLSKVW